MVARTYSYRAASKNEVDTADCTSQLRQWYSRTVDNSREGSATPASGVRTRPDSCIMELQIKVLVWHMEIMIGTIMREQQYEEVYKVFNVPFCFVVPTQALVKGRTSKVKA